MHTCRYLILAIILAPLTLNAQQKAGAGDITGLWKGTLYNDSTGQYYRYEIAISENKGKLSGFSHTWFLFKDKRYFGLKKVKVKKAGNGKIIIEDNGLITNNYPIEPAKNVRQLNVLTLSVTDENMILEGPFSTNATKQYASLTGHINLSKKQDYWQSDLVPHLQELGLIPNLSFVQNDLAIIAAPKITTNLPGQIEKVPGITEENEIKIATDTVSTGIIFPGANLDTTVKVNERDVAFNTVAKSTNRDNIAIIKQKDEKNIAASPVNKPVEKKEQPVKNVTAENKTTTVTARAEEKKSQSPAPVIKQINPIVKTEPIKTTPVVATQPAEQPQAVVKAEETIKPKVLKVDAPASTEVKSAALLVKARSNIIQQTVLFSSDSLQISLFDNGEVDGDTVSVLMNGEVIIAKQRLSTNAFRQTIYLDKSQDNIELLMYAENLGSIPPNTGLLVVKDGKDIYEIRFRGDYEKNAAIILKRKR